MSQPPLPKIGEVVSHGYQAGYIVLSYLVSFCGCWTALELLYRRTSADGFQNWSADIYIYSNRTY